MWISRNTFSSNVIEITTPSGSEILVDNVGSFDAGLGTVVIDYFNPSSISGGATEIKLSVVPANQSAVTPQRNDLIVFDPDRSATTGVIVTSTI